MHVIAGHLKGRRLVYPKDIRPTSQKVREAVFSILASRTKGAVVLDLYAGSGAFGIEALSRGTEDALFVDSSSKSVASIRKNLAETLSKGKVIKEDAKKFLTRDHAKYDLIFIDPPYGSLDAEVLDTAAARLKNGGIIVAEVSKREELPRSQKAELVDIKKYGDTLVGFYENSE